jgi:hypothetical protein
MNSQKTRVSTKLVLLACKVDAIRPHPFLSPVLGKEANMLSLMASFLIAVLAATGQADVFSARLSAPNEPIFFDEVDGPVGSLRDCCKEKHPPITYQRVHGGIGP